MEITLNSDLITILQSIQSQLTTIGNRFTQVETKLDEFANRFINIETKLVEFENRLINIETKLVEFENRLINIETKLVEFENRLTSLENVVTRIEYEHGNKIDLLLQYYTKDNLDKHELYDSTIDHLNFQINNHEIRIQVLEER